MTGNIDVNTVASFGDEWSRFNESALSADERLRIWRDYFSIFPFDRLPVAASGFDMGCGSGRWACVVAPKVGFLHCIDPAEGALRIARENLSHCDNVMFHHGGVSGNSLAPDSQDFGYSLGVLHHIPDTASALKSCVRLLKPGAPFLLYVYYRFDHRPAWFRAVWKLSESIRKTVKGLPPGLKAMVSDALAGVVYFPMATLAKIVENVGGDVSMIPLSYYRDKSFYTMRTDCRDRFGTPLEQRFTRDELAAMMRDAGLNDIIFSDREPYWVACGVKA